ncbi:MAG: hypothetical protein EXR72_20610 [Myxococcales bacterium]|nr:hypothetical protein [Myxococcales bacterium]
MREFRRAYELSHYPDLLLNIARAETRLGREEIAITYLERSLDARPNADDSPSVRAEIAARRSALEGKRAAAESEEARRKASAEATEARRQASEATAKVQQADEAARRSDAAAVRSGEEARSAGVARLRVPAYLLMGIGVLAVGGGTAAGVLARQQAGVVERGGAAAGGVPQPFAGDPSAAETAGRRAQAIGIAFDVIGVAFAATGTGLLIYSFKMRAKEQWAFLAPAPCGLTVGGAF